jgi:hypothetical protein
MTTYTAVLDSEKAQTYRIKENVDDGAGSSSSRIVARIYDSKLAEQYVQFMNNNCVQKLKPKEPFFLLKASDQTASKFVRGWAENARLSGVSAEKVQGALADADAMDRWPIKKLPD